MTLPCDNDSCSASARLPCEWIKTITDNLRTPTGQWIDYNNALKKWKALQRYERIMLCEEDMPTRPNPHDYDTI